MDAGLRPDLSRSKNVDREGNSFPKLLDLWRPRQEGECPKVEIQNVVASALLFGSGKMVCTGTTSEERAKEAVNRIVDGRPYG